MFQGVGSRLRRAFSGDHGPANARPTDESSTPLSELSNVIFTASGAERRVYSATDYRNSADRTRSDLISAKEQLEEALQKFQFNLASPVGRTALKEQNLALLNLARINIALGDYEEAESLYGRCCPPTEPTNDLTHYMPTLEKHEIEILISYLMFLASSRRNLDYADRAGRLVFWIASDSNWTPDEQCSAMVSLIRIFIARGNYTEAFEHIQNLDILNPSVLLNAQTSVTVCLSRAITLAGMDQKSDSKRDFLQALVSSAVIFGMWHHPTLEVLYYYGKALKSWGNYDAAASFLRECCLGRYHRLGASHPSSKLAYTELEMCKGSQPQLEAIHGFNDVSLSEESKLSVAYEHIYLRTVVDLLASAGETSFKETESILQSLLDEKRPLKVESSEHRAIFTIRIHRTLARCKFEQGKVDEAISLVNGPFKRSAEGVLQSSLDLAMYYSGDSSGKTKSIELSRAVFFDVDTKLNRDQASAFHRRLTQLNLTHFTYNSIIRNPLPIKVLENVGTGAYAIVESVEIGSRLYARKSIALPRYNQNRIRQTIQNEVSVIRSLAHPHIVRVYCTYEEKSRFAIVLDPLASCDLEAYLESAQHSTPQDPETGHHKLIWKWLRCLANALAFIHSKGIRHKDIKTRNILIKDFEVIFADFGSSHAFLDEGTSVTEGPAFGHTLLYCAPECVSWEKRSRSADIFSLGCVYTEMATSLDGRPISDYFEFRQRNCENGMGGETHAYHATLDLVDAWFEKAEPGVNGLYLDFIQPMLSKDPEARPTGSHTSDAIQAYFKKSTGQFMANCSKCYPMQWDPENITTIPDFVQDVMSTTSD